METNVPDNTPKRIKTTLYLDQPVIDRLASIKRKTGASASEIKRRAIIDFLDARFPISSKRVKK